MTSDNKLNALERLSKLRESGAITEAEFAAQKAAVLDSGESVSEVPFYRRLWVVVVLTCLILTFWLALLILATGDVYRRKEGSLVPIGKTARYVYASFLGLWLAAVAIKTIADPDTLKRGWSQNQVGSVGGSGGQTAVNDVTAPDTCDSSDAADMVKNAIEQNATSSIVHIKVLDFGHPQELLFDKKSNVRYCQADAELNTGSSKLSYKLYYGPSGSELVEVKDGEDAYGARDMAAEIVAQQQHSASDQDQSQRQLARDQPQQRAQMQPVEPQAPQVSPPGANQTTQAAKFTDDLAFTNYPVDVYTGPITVPDFSGGAKDFAEYRTGISEAVRRGPNFGGTMAIAELGCGTDCIKAYATDVRSGSVYELPVGGEDNYQLRLTYKPNSSLIRAQWTGGDSDHPTCVRAFFQWTGTKFMPLQKREIAGGCPETP